MKIYEKIIFDMTTLDVVDEKSFEYEGPVALCGGGGGDNTVDTDYNARLATIFEQQNQMSMAMYNFYRYGTFNNPYRSGANKANAQSTQNTIAKTPTQTIPATTEGGAPLQIKPSQIGDYTARGYGEGVFVDSKGNLVDHPADQLRGYEYIGGASTPQALGWVFVPQEQLITHNNGATYELPSSINILPSSGYSLPATTGSNTTSAEPTGTGGTQPSNPSPLSLYGLPTQGSGPNGQITLSDILAQNPSQANLDLAQVAANAQLIPGQTALAKAQTAWERNMQPKIGAAKSKAFDLAMQNNETDAMRQAGSDVVQQYKNLRDQRWDDVRRTGSVPGSGANRAMMFDLNFDRTKAIAAARTAARNKSRLDQYSQLSQFYQTA